MENFKNYWHLIILTILVLVFCSSITLQNVFKVEFKDGLLISISFISIFATFGGAYLGARISGYYTLKLNDVERRERVLREIRELQHLFAHNQQGIIELLNKIFSECGFNNEAVNMEFKRTGSDKNTDEYYLNVFKKLQTTKKNYLRLNEMNIMNVKNYSRILMDNSFKTYLFDNVNGNKLRSNYIYISIQLLEILFQSVIDKPDNIWTAYFIEDEHKTILIKTAFYIFKINDEIINEDPYYLLNESTPKLTL